MSATPITSFKMKNLAANLVSIMSLFVTLPNAAQADNITPFLGAYTGSADFDENGTSVHRDMSAKIAETDDGFSISWTSDTIEFVPSARDGIYSSAMQTNVFGKQIPLNPLKGEPFVWSRIVGNTLTVFSLFINEAGNYEMQEYHRTLTEGGLDLEFRRFQNGEKVRAVETFLKRE